MLKVSKLVTMQVMRLTTSTCLKMRLNADLFTYLREFETSAGPPSKMFLDDGLHMHKATIGV